MYLENKHADTLAAIKKGDIGDGVTAVLEAACKELSAKYNN
jgi:hypothetical protein